MGCQGEVLDITPRLCGAGSPWEGCHAGRWPPLEWLGSELPVHMLCVTSPTCDLVFDQPDGQDVGVGGHELAHVLLLAAVRDALIDR